MTNNTQLIDYFWDFLFLAIVLYLIAYIVSIGDKK
jgi:hypothetical protein